MWCDRCRSDPRSYLARDGDTPASIRVTAETDTCTHTFAHTHSQNRTRVQSHADPTKHASPGCGNFSTRSAPRSKGCHPHLSSAHCHQTSEQTDLALTLVPTCPCRQLFEFRFMAGCASPGYKYDVHTRTRSQNVAAPAYSFPSLLRFDASVSVYMSACVWSGARVCIWVKGFVGMWMCGRECVCSMQSLLAQI